MDRMDGIRAKGFDFLSLRKCSGVTGNAMSTCAKWAPSNTSPVSFGSMALETLSRMHFERLDGASALGG